MTARSESVVLCEGYYDRAFWAGWLAHLGCSDLRPEPGKKVYDPFGTQVRGGHFAFHSAGGRFIRIVPCMGKDNVRKTAKYFLGKRTVEPLSHLILNLDPDTRTGDTKGMPTGMRLQDVEALVKTIDPSAVTEGNLIKMDGGATEVALIRWEVEDSSAPGLPEQQTLERLVCSALVAAYPERGPCVQQWLDSRHDPPQTGPKHFAWSYMAGWHAEHGCEDFLRRLWEDADVVREFQSRLTATGAWPLVEKVAA